MISATVLPSRAISISSAVIRAVDSGTLSFRPRSCAPWPLVRPRRSAACRVLAVTDACVKTPRDSSSGEERRRCRPARRIFLTARRLPAHRNNLPSNQPKPAPARSPARTARSTPAARAAASDSVRRNREQDAQERRDQRPPPEEQGDSRQASRCSRRARGRRSRPAAIDQTLRVEGVAPSRMVDPHEHAEDRPHQDPHACCQSVMAMPMRNSSAVQMLAWNITWLTPWATAPMKPTAGRRSPRHDPGAPRPAREEEGPGRDDERCGVRRERHIPPHEPGHERRDDAADDRTADAHRPRTEEEQRGDSDQRGVEAVDPGRQLGLVEFERPRRCRSDRRADDRTRPP